MIVGFIGTGSMGSILIESMIKTQALHPGQIVTANRTLEKAEKLAAQYPGLQTAATNREAASQSDILFLCVKPKQFKEVIDDIKSEVRESQIVVSITSTVLIRHLEEHLPCKIAKVIPSITNYVCSGATLTMYGSRMAQEDIFMLEKLLRHMSKPVAVSEEYTRICSDLSSCGPAFVAFFIEEFINAAVKYTGLPKEEATRLASEMVLGTGLLLTDGGFSPEKLRERVTVPGGITAEALRILSLDLEGTFERLIRTTHNKYYDELDIVEGLLYNPAGEMD